MKNIPFIIAFLLCFCGFSQTEKHQDIKTTIKEVTVFQSNAQVTREKSVDLFAGETILKFINLSPFIDAKSIQVKADGAVTILNVSHQQNFIDKLEKQKELVTLESKLIEITTKIELESTLIEILKEELTFLNENRNIGGKNESLTVTNLRETATYYSSRLTALKLKEIERNQTLSKLKNERRDLENQINTFTSKREYPNGEILVKVASKNNSKVTFEISYIVGNAGWFPSYDIRAKNVNEPIELIYKANVKQDTKIDWKDVKLKLSTANPTVSGIAPELKPYFLNYNLAPPVYKLESNSVSGIVTDGSSPLPGASVIVKGTTIGATTDFDGKYSISIPNGARELVFSYLGYVTKTVSIDKNVLNVQLQEDASTLDEVVVVGYGTKKNNSISQILQGVVPGVKIRGAASIEIPVEQIENQTSVDFEIKMPYTIKSDNKSYAVDISNYSLAADYQYYSVPKINKNAFLMANITDWEKYNLLEGEANIFFEETYIGKSLLDVRYAKDTLQISLGVDKNIQIEREKITDFASKKFIGSRKEELRNWKINIKNNKNQQISMVIFDQIPVSVNEEIKVEILNISGANHTLETGELKWIFKLNPKESKVFDLKYTVKYPKNKNLLIE
ncbi:mucoidy inhibitor MuiA family protein [Polaribacter sp. BAL334]|uniref:mucoidy inhibitor MuiA family protein n=1 Tax=Polaribacter sp. BAL334 TaxID=1708178 RepID=UPI0018D1FD59|nr:mucoidy inhibitor MuiA family protein [Polaribacter sp. BAL334]MBG7612650.1 mucoidy inhibitor MuiA family protein [Polaribacter sp. BAL334]